MYMAQNALTQWIEFLLEEKEPVPLASDVNKIKPLNNQFVNLIRADVRNNRAVRRTVSIPGWLDTKAAEAGISLSKVLQDALKEKLGV
jgi:hypothetical protein